MTYSKQQKVSEFTTHDPIRKAYLCELMLGIPRRCLHNVMMHGARVLPSNSLCWGHVSLTSCAGVVPACQRSLPISSYSAAFGLVQNRRGVQRQPLKLVPRRPTPRGRKVTTPHAGVQLAGQPLATHDVTVTVLAAFGAYVWVRLFDWLATEGVLEQVGCQDSACM